MPQTDSRSNSGEPRKRVVPVRPVVRITRPESGRYVWIHNGRAGSIQTAAIMADLVRDAAVRDKALENFVVHKIVVPAGLDSHSDPYEVADAIYRYVQRLHYIYDPAGTSDSIQSARQVLADGKGDCDDLSVLLATLLAMVGFKPRFVLARYGKKTKGFDHVYVDLELAQGRVALDPSTRKHGIGWESPKAIEKIAYPIFGGSPNGLADVLGKLGSIFSRSAARGGDGLADPVVVSQTGNGINALGSATIPLPVVLLIAGGAVYLYHRRHDFLRWAGLEDFLY